MPNKEMVEYLRQGGWADEKTAEALLANPREKFVPPSQVSSAYYDTPLPIGFGQTISAPSMVAEMTKLADVKKGMKILEVGAGSGWQAAILAFLAGKKGIVFTTERIPELVACAKQNIEAMGYENVRVIYADGSKGLADHAPFDRIIVTAAGPEVPKPLIQQLAEGGKLLIPVGAAFWQELVLVEKIGGEAVRKSLMPVVFVPLIGEHGHKQ